MNRLECMRTLYALADKATNRKEGEALYYAANLLMNLGNGGRKRKISEETRLQIKRDKELGYTISEVARRNSVSVSTAHRIINGY